MQSLKISIFDYAGEAQSAGYSYTAPIKAVNLTEAVVVRNGTVNGNPTVDLIFEDSDGNKYVAMITGRLLKALPL